MDLDKEIIVVGRGAIPGTRALNIIRAMRAAEADCYARIAARAFGLQISRDTTVRDFALKSDTIRSRVCKDLLNGVKFTKFEVLDGGICTATGQLTIREVVEVVTRTQKRVTEGKRVKLLSHKEVETKNRDTVIEETGKAVVLKDEEQAGPVIEREVVVERILSREIVVE